MQFIQRFGGCNFSFPLLFLFMKKKKKVVTALPLNGGAYNALLNTTTKLVAAIGGTLTVLS